MIPSGKKKEKKKREKSQPMINLGYHMIRYGERELLDRKSVV